MTRAVVAGGEMRFRDRHADAVGESLAERTGRGLHARRESALRMSGRVASPLAKQLNLFERQVIASQMEQAVKQHRAMARREDEAITIDPAADWSDCV